MTLDQLLPGDQARVTAVEGGHGLQRRLNQLGIHPGDVVSLTSRGAFRGPLLITVHGMRIALGRGVAHHMLVEPIDARPAPCPPLTQRRGRHGRR